MHCAPSLVLTVVPGVVLQSDRLRWHMRPGWLEWCMSHATDVRRPPPERRAGEPLLIAPRRIALVLGSVAALLIAAHLVLALNYYVLGIDVFGATMLWVLFDLTGEVTVPTWYASSLLLLASGLLALVAAIGWRLRDRGVRQWGGLAALFLLLSVDEASDLHGAVSYRLQAAYDTDGLLAYPWVLPGAIFAVIVAVIYIPFLRRLPRATRRGFLLAGGLYIGGALGLEVIEAVTDPAREMPMRYMTLVAIEEGLEKAGVIVLIATLLTHLGCRYPALTMIFTPRARQSAWAREMHPAGRASGGGHR